MTKRGLLRRAYYELIGVAGALRGFRAGAAEAFGFLVDEFAFEPMVFEETSYGALATFESPTAVVELHLDWTEELIYVYVRPSDRNDDRATIGAPGVLLDAIMLHRGERPEKQIGVMKAARMQKTLREYARALRDDAPEALMGDFRDLILLRTTRPEARWRLLDPVQKQP